VVLTVPVTVEGLHLEIKPALKFINSALNDLGIVLEVLPLSVSVHMMFTPLALIVTEPVADTPAPADIPLDAVAGCATVARLTTLRRATRHKARRRRGIGSPFSAALIHFTVHCQAGSIALATQVRSAT
jgi:hypothetical protein